MSQFGLQRDQPSPSVPEPEVAAEPGGAEIHQVRAVPGLVAGGSALRRSSTAVDDPLGGTQVSPDIESQLAGTRGRGRPLPDRVATSLGAAMGADLSGVRVHDNAQADHISRSVQAVAFTQGSDVYFSQGSYSPSTTSGQRLLAHELAHVVQGSGGSSGALSRSTIGRADDPAESAADRVADQTMAALRRTTAPDPDGGHEHGPHEHGGREHGRHDGRGTISRVIRRGGKKNKGKDVTVVAKQVAEHAYDKHHEEWGSDMSKSEFADLASDMMMDGSGKTVEKALSSGRRAFYHAEKNVLVIWNTASPESSTCFRPTNGKTYYDGLS
jgi:hypothetical protein